MDNRYYALNEARWLGNKKAGDPYYYQLGEAPNMLGQISQPWFMQNGKQPNFMKGGPQSKMVQPKRWLDSLGQISQPNFMQDDGDQPNFMELGQWEQPNFMELGQISQPWFMQNKKQPDFMQGGAQSKMVQAKRWLNSLGDEPTLPSADYQGRKWANEFGEIAYSGLGAMGGPLGCFLCVAVAAGVAAGVCWWYNKKA